MENMKFEEKLARYLDAGFPIIYINTYEEVKAENIIKKIVKDKEIYGWSEIKGRYDLSDNSSINEHETLIDCLNYLSNSVNESYDSIINNNVIILKDCHEYIQDSKIAYKIKGLARMIMDNNLDANIIIISNILVIPKELEKFITIIEIDYLNVSEIKEVILAFVSEMGIRNVQNNFVDEFSQAFKGLTEFEIKNLLNLAYSEDGELGSDDLQLIFEQKQQMIKKSGVLEMIPLKESIDDIGGLENLKKWLKRKSKIYSNIEKAQIFGVDMPKGVLIAGVPGCGKSLNAKAAAHLFNVPLLRLDMGRLMGKYVGESEANLRNAITLAEAISPCVLWIDELEKAFAGIGGSGGGAEVTTRLFGNFLTWMQEKVSPTFVVTTANDITKLPPELLRKGRFDEIFYVGLPTEEEREKILEIHIEKRRPDDLNKIDLKELAEKTKGYTGADIEGVIVDTIEEAFFKEKDFIKTQDIINVISNTTPLAEIMKVNIENMIEEYETRKFINASKK